MRETAIAPRITRVTPDLTWRDRLALASVRCIGKPAIALIADARVVRALTNGPAKRFLTTPEGTQLEPDSTGGLRVIPAGTPDEAGWLMYIHGGGFLAGSPYTHLALATRLAQAAKLKLYLPTYRLAPEHPYPAGRDDLRLRYKAHIDRLGAPVALAGDSAGANLALLLAQHARDTGWALPGAIGLMSPVADLSQDIAARMAEAPDEMLFPRHRLFQIRDTYLQGHDAADPAASPLLGDLKGLPHTLIQASATEAAAPDARALAQRLDSCQVELWDGLPHVWQIFAGRAPVADAALDRMGMALAAHDIRTERAS